jgi:predicted transglutaminase-like cysteine proteinase
MKLQTLKLIVVAAILGQPGVAFAWSASLEKSMDYTKMAAQVHGYTNAPIGHVTFCNQFPRECISFDSGNLRVKLTTAARKQLAFINESVNREIKPVSDQEQYGVVERWIYPESGQGDCEDYVLLKKKRLVESRWPASALLITVVKDEFGEGHAVLTVRTDRGDLILDNKRSEIMPWRETGYFFIKRQSARDPQQWVSLIPQDSTPTVSASGTKNIATEDE